MGQTPLVGPAIDRIFWDNLQTFLDPESVEAINQAARLRKNRNGNEEWWPSGQTLPERAPDLSSALGGLNS